jgi:tetratricopeptide (TPR) repeat protein
MVAYLLRARTALIGLAMVSATVSAEAQTTRVGGIVKDEGGAPVRRVMVSARTPDAQPTPFSASSDDRGRFTIIGLSPGTWTFVAEAPGYESASVEIAVRAIGPPNPPIAFTLRQVNAVGPRLGSLSGEEIQARLAAADTLFEQGQWNAALDAYTAVLARAPSLTTIHLQIAAAHRARKDYASSLAAYRALLEVDPANEQALVGAASTRLESGDPEGAEQELLAVAASPLAGPRVFATLGDIARTQGALERAVDWYVKAADADRSWGEPRYRLAELALAAGTTERAVALLQEVVAVAPQSPEAALARETLARLAR